MNIETMCAASIYRITQKDCTIEDLVYIGAIPQFIAVASDLKYIHPLGLLIHKKQGCKQDSLIMYIYDDSGDCPTGYFISIKNASYTNFLRMAPAFDRIRAMHPGGKYPVDNATDREPIAATVRQVLIDLDISSKDVSAIMSRADCRMFVRSVYESRVSGRPAIDDITSYMVLREGKSPSDTLIQVCDNDGVKGIVGLLCNEKARDMAVVLFKFNGSTIVPISDDNVVFC